MISPLLIAESRFPLFGSVVNDNLEAQLSALFSKDFTPLSFDRSSGYPLSDLMSFDNGYAFSSDDYLPSGRYKIITIGNVGDGYVDSTKVNFLDEIPQRIEENYLLHIGDLVISLTGNVGRVAIIRENNLLLNQRVARIVPKHGGSEPFLYCLFRQNRTKVYLENISKGTAQANLSPVELLKTIVDYDVEDILQFSKSTKVLLSAILDTSQEIALLTQLLNTYLTILSR